MSVGFGRLRNTPAGLSSWVGMSVELGNAGRLW